MIETRSSSTARNQNAENQDMNEQQTDTVGSQPSPAGPSRVHYLTQEVDLAKYNAGLQLIPQFTGFNWEDFKTKLQMQFNVMGLDTFLNHPPNLTDPVDVRNDKIATAQICLRLAQCQYKQVSTCENTNEIWNKLRKSFDQSAESKTATLFIQFVHLQKRQSETMKTYLDRTITMYHELTVYKVNIGEIALCAKILDGLPETYQQIKAAARASQGMKIPTLTNLLLSAERDQKNDSRAPPTGEFKNSNTEWKPRRSPVKRLNNNQNNGRRKYCTRCKNSSHNSAECWFLKKEQPRNNKAANNNSLPPDQNNDSELFTGFHTSHVGQEPENSYLIDSGANVSMTNNKMILNNYRAYEKPLEVICSNGQKIPAYGRGTITISKNPPISLKNDLFVSNLTFVAWMPGSVTSVMATSGD
jgi:hypothetical protein